MTLTSPSDLGATRHLVVSQRLRERRRTLGLTQKQVISRLARLGVLSTNKALSSLEHGSGLDVAKLPELAEALDCSVTWLLGLTDDPHSWEPAGRRPTAGPRDAGRRRRGGRARDPLGAGRSPLAFGPFRASWVRSPGRSSRAGQPAREGRRPESADRPRQRGGRWCALLAGCGLRDRWWLRGHLGRWSDRRRDGRAGPIALTDQRGSVVTLERPGPPDRHHPAAGRVDPRRRRPERRPSRRDAERLVGRCARRDPRDDLPGRLGGSS